MKRIILLGSLSFGLLRPMDKPQLTPNALIKAAQKGMFSAFEDITKSGVDIDTVSDGTTALHEASKVLSIKSVKMLLILKPNPNSIDKDGNSPLTVIITNIKKHFDASHWEPGAH